MRSHYLRDLSIDGKDAVLAHIPDFDFYNVRRVVEFQWTAVSDSDSSGGATLGITAEYDFQLPNTRSQVVTMRCLDVKVLKLSELTGSFFFCELEIDDLSEDQLEGIRYRIKDYGTNVMELLCGSIEVAILS